MASAPAKGKEHPLGVVGDLFKNETLLAAGTVGAAAYVASAAYPSTWAHEMGHAWTIDQLYTNSQPSVEVFPFEGGVTRWRASELIPLGQRLGENGARALVSASGTLVDMGIATAAFGVGFKLRKKSPVLGHALMGYSALSVLNSVLYAGSAVGGDLAALAATGHDFASLGVRVGLPPLASIAIMASILPLEYAALKWLEGDGEKAAGEPKATLARPN